MVTISKKETFVLVARSVKPDAKKRIVLPNNLVQDGITYHVYSSTSGQIILDPQVTIPLSEAWLFRNPDALASVQRGLLDAAQGKVSTIDLDTL